ncbi:hypothetical protein BDR26DRAFT_660010 [Obelidium mucronatum]|nr:hypothetical protein BDR26DRAFT_660010 [Obelidium mucronatum]
MINTAMKPRCLKGNWLEQDVVEEEKLMAFVRERNDNTLTWTSTFTRITNLEKGVPKLVTKAWDSFPETPQPQQQPPTPAALLNDPSRRHGHLKSCPMIPKPPMFPRESFRYGQKVILVNSSSGGSASTKTHSNNSVDACLTYDAWTKIGSNYRLMVSTLEPQKPLSRNVFEITPFERDKSEYISSSSSSNSNININWDNKHSSRHSSHQYLKNSSHSCSNHQQHTEVIGNVLTYGSRFRLTTVIGGKRVAVSCPSVSINNLPGGGEGNQALVLTEDIWDLSCAFSLGKTFAEIPNGVFKEPVADQMNGSSAGGHSFVLTCVAGKRVVTSHRERKLMSLLGGDVYSVVSAQVTGTYVAPSAMCWRFVSVDK